MSIDNTRQLKKAKRKAIRSIELNRIAQKKNRLITALRNSNSIVSTACIAARVSRARFYVYMEEDERFKQRVLNIKEETIDHVESKLHELIESSEPSAIYFFLKCKAKHRGYVEKQEYKVDIPGVKQTIVIGGREIDFQ